MAGISKTSIYAAAVGSAALLLSTGASADDKVSASLLASYNTHFVSYGLDVWGGGDEFYGDRSTTFVQGDLAFDLSPITLSLGTWTEWNDNAVSGIGGNLQEVDIYGGIGYTIGPVTLGATYQEWYYASDVERILDLSVAVDDTGWIIPDFGFAPKLVWHDRIKGNGGQEVGSALVFSIGPGFTIMESDTYPVTLAIPAGVAFFLTDDFQGGTEEGYAYSYVGGSLGIPLAFISSDFGEWSANFDLIYYMTEQDLIPGNVEENFLTGSFGIKVGF